MLYRMRQLNKQSSALILSVCMLPSNHDVMKQTGQITRPLQTSTRLTAYGLRLLLLLALASECIGMLCVYTTCSYCRIFACDTAVRTYASTILFNNIGLRLPPYVHTTTVISVHTLLIVVPAQEGLIAAVALVSRIYHTQCSRYAVYHVV